MLSRNSVHIWRNNDYKTIYTTYTNARARLAKLLDLVTQDREIVVLQRRGGEDVAMIAAEELSSILETAYLLRSPQNAERLLSAFARGLKNQPTSMTVDEFRREVGLGGAR